MSEEPSGFPRKWETIIETTEGHSTTSRMMVPGGWLVRYIRTPPHISGGYGVALTFVPDPERVWVLKP